VKVIYDLFLFNLPLATIRCKIIAAASANSSSTSLSVMFIFGTRDSHYRGASKENGVDLWRRLQERASWGLVDHVHAWHVTGLRHSEVVFLLHQRHFLGRPPANFFHQTHILWSRESLVSINRMHLGVNGIFAMCPFAHRKRIGLTERCSLWDAFNGNVAIIHCVSKKFTLFVFTITKSDVDQF